MDTQTQPNPAFANLEDEMRKILEETGLELVPKGTPRLVPDAAKEEAHNPKESRRDRFKRIGNSRMQRALSAIRLLGNLASPHYAWTANDVETMQIALSIAIGKAISRFQRATAPQEEDHFEFSNGDNKRS